MKTVRFSKVVEKCGKPEVYLLLTETDAEFQKALEAGKVMSLSDDPHGAGKEYGTVGYDKKRKGQLLLFSKTLKAFENVKVVGIKYNLFAEEEPRKAASKKNTRPTPVKEGKTESAKIIEFPTPEANEEEEDESVSELKGYVRQAIRALEKNNSVAAYNLLKRSLGEN